jgi:hypothetical protein
MRCPHGILCYCLFGSQLWGKKLQAMYTSFCIDNSVIAAQELFRKMVPQKQEVVVVGINKNVPSILWTKLYFDCLLWSNFWSP